MTPIRPLPNIWASNIAVETHADFLKVTGTVPNVSEEGREARDVFLGYLDWPSHSEKRGGLRSPHIQFANAVADEDLVAFVQTFGPVAAIWLAEVDGTITAFQSVEDLRRERQLYAAALGLLTELEKEKGSTSDLEAIQRCIVQICDGCAHWPREWENEAEWRRSKGYLPPNWRFGARELENLHRLRWSAKVCPQPKELRDILLHSGAIYCGHYVLCSLVNTFIPEVLYTGDVYEAAAWDSRLFGVRPVLYHILRREYLRHGRTHVCANVRCNKFFSVERSGQSFCTEECSRKQRQRDYWALHGATLRRKRREKRGRSRKGRSAKEGLNEGL